MTSSRWQIMKSCLLLWRACGGDTRSLPRERGGPAAGLSRAKIDSGGHGNFIRDEAPSGMTIGRQDGRSTGGAWRDPSAVTGAGEGSVQSSSCSAPEHRIHHFGRRIFKHLRLQNHCSRAAEDLPIFFCCCWASTFRRSYPKFNAAQHPEKVAA